MKVTQIILFLLAFIVASASAAIKIVYPSAEYYWVADEVNNEILWTSEASDPPKFAVYLNNPQRPEITNFSLLNGVDTAPGKIEIPGITFFGPGFQLLFTDTLNPATNYSMSETFEIKPSGTTPIAYVSPTPTPPPAPPASSGESGSAAPSATPSKNSSNSIHNYGNYGFGTLVLITLFIIVLF